MRDTLWCHNCRAWQAYEDAETFDGFVCAVCGDTILCDVCGQAWTDIPEHDHREDT